MPGPTGEDTDDELDVIDSVPAHPPGPIGGAAAARPDAEDEDDGIDGDLLLGESSHAAARCCAASQEVTCERSARTVLQGRPQLALLAPRCADRAPRCGANGRRCHPCAPHLGREAGRQGGREAGSVLLWFSSTNYYIERLGREAGSVLLSHRVMEGF